MQNFTLVDIPTFKDERGILSVVERFLPFEIKRIYWIREADGHTRGGHRHYVTRQALIAITGEVSVYMNDGSRSEIVVLSGSNKLLIVEPKDWHAMTFSQAAVLLVLSSHEYNIADYIDEPYE